MITYEEFDHDKNKLKSPSPEQSFPKARNESGRRQNIPSSSPPRHPQDRPPVACVVLGSVRTQVPRRGLRRDARLLRTARSPAGVHLSFAHGRPTHARPSHARPTHSALLLRRKRTRSQGIIRHQVNRPRLGLRGHRIPRNSNGRRASSLSRARLLRRPQRSQHNTLKYTTFFQYKVNIKKNWPESSDKYSTTQPPTDVARGRLQAIFTLAFLLLLLKKSHFLEPAHSSRLRF